MKNIRKPRKLKLSTKVLEQKCLIFQSKPPMGSRNFIFSQLEPLQVFDCTQRASFKSSQVVITVTYLLSHISSDGKSNV